MKRSLLPKFLLIVFTCFILTVFFLGSAAGSFFVDRYLDTHTLASSAELSREALHDEPDEHLLPGSSCGRGSFPVPSAFPVFLLLPSIKQDSSCGRRICSWKSDSHYFPVKRCDELGFLGASLQYMAGEINKAGEYQRKFISNISHDFRSPLTSIKGYVEAILDGTIPPEMQERYLKIVVSETERLNKLTGASAHP